MYESHFGLRERPFDLTPNPRFLVLTASHREALSNLEYAIAARKGLTVLIGEAGTGKTTILRTAIERRAERVHCIHLTNPALTREEFIEMLSAQFELSTAARTSKTALILELEALLISRRKAGETTVLIIDEAQSLPMDLLEEIRLLANIETNEDKLLTVVIAGQPELVARLNDEALRQLKQRVALRCELRPLSLRESAAYMAGRIHAAGGTAAQLFTREAVTLIAERSRGIARLINVIADNALLTAFATGAQQVTRQTVQDVCKDFDLESTNEVVAQMPAALDIATGSRMHTAEESAIASSNAVAVGAPPQRSVARGLFAAFAGSKRRFSFFSDDETSQ